MPLDPRSAPTEPSLRRRVSLAESLSSRDAPTPVEPHSLRYRARRRRLGVFSVLLAIIGVAVLIFSASGRSRPPPVAAPVVSKARSVEAARTAEVSVVDGSEQEDELAVQVIEPAVYPSSPDGPIGDPVTKMQENSGQAGARKSGHGPKPSPPVVRVQSGLAALPHSKEPRLAPAASAAAPEVWFPPE